MANIFITGGTGYIGTRLINVLSKRGHTITAFVRGCSEHKLPNTCTPFIGNVLDATTYSTAMRGCDTLVHLVGVAHPSPRKSEEFRTIDLASVQQVIPVAKQCGIQHFVYVSVAHPAPVMKPYWQARAKAEELIRQYFTNRTFIRPWYVLGPGHWWAYMLMPLYAFWKLLPSTRATALRLDLVTIDNIIATLVNAVEHTPPQERLIEAQEIKSIQL